MTEDIQQKTDRELLEEIHEHTRKTRNYIMWQLIITVALVVLPLLLMAFIIPTLLSGFSSALGTGVL